MRSAESTKSFLELLRSITQSTGRQNLQRFGPTGVLLTLFNLFGFFWMLRGLFCLDLGCCCLLLFGLAFFFSSSEYFRIILHPSKVSMESGGPGLLSDKELKALPYQTAYRLSM